MDWPNAAAGELVPKGRGQPVREVGGGGWGGVDYLLELDWYDLNVQVIRLKW